ncbi:MAG: hypothetical protein K2P68_01185 [Sphingomonas sp.]|nr:hypothetical protein [Sphingomonas sp.]
MVLGLSLPMFTLLHSAISIIAIAAGLIYFVWLGLRRHWLDAFNNLFLLFTALTSITGFLFPPKPIGPPFIFGVVSLLLLAIALFALYRGRLAGAWRPAYLISALLAQWLNMVVLVVQSYQKIPALHAFAPTGAEPPVLATQAAVLLLVLLLGWRVLRRRAH